MSLPSWRSPSWWLLALLCAFGFLVWANYQRAERVRHVTRTDSEDAVIDATSSTGYAGGKRWLIVPEHNSRSYQWIAETQQMLARGEWRVRHVDYENAPAGREVHAASPYRWWLGLIAWVDHAISGRPLGLSVERGALWSDPLLHLALLVGTTLFVARHFGTWPATLAALGLATLYPFAGGFLPGVPDDRGLARALALWSVLPLVAGVVHMRGPSFPPSHSSSETASALAHLRARRLFLVAGFVGGLGLWIGTVQQTLLLVGIAVGGLAAAWIGSRGTPGSLAKTAPIAPWRTWALAGAATCVAGYLVERFPSHLGLRLEVNHPLYGLAWIGLGEFLAQIETWCKKGKSFWNGRRAMLLSAAGAALAALPVVMVLGETQALLTLDRFAGRLSCLPDGVVATSFSAWIRRDGLTGPVAATCLPLLLLAPALWLLVSRTTSVAHRAGIALTLGPVLATLLVALNQLAWWNVVGAMVLAVGVAASAALPARITKESRWIGLGIATLAFLPGVVQLLPPAAQGERIAFTRCEAEGLVERTLAHWIADHDDPDGAVILAPPDRTTRWCFHGGLRGIGTANWENRDGLAKTIQIVTATTADEAQAVLNEHGVTHIILPSWDTDLDQFARWTLHQPEDAFINALHHWALPPWLRPLPYKLPENAGFDGQAVAIFEVTDDSNRPASAARLAEYFVESGQMENATISLQALQRYPTDLGALAALAQVEKALGNAEGFARTLDTVLASLAAGADRALAWDRRVSLAIVLAQGERHDLAREQLRRCLERLDEARVRSLTTGALFRLLVLSQAYDLPVGDPALGAGARQLLPAELRRRL